jgi:hypothetical protein
MLKTLTLYAAIAPIYKDDGVTLNMSIKEDWDFTISNILCYNAVNLLLFNKK